MHRGADVWKMRNKKEIETSLREYGSSDNEVIIELLLDIRDLLLNNQEEK